MCTILIEKIQFKRGLKKNLPKLSPAEIGMTTDSNEVFIGSEIGNIRLLNQNDAENMATESSVRDISTRLNKTAIEIKLSDYGLTPDDNDGTNFMKLCSALDTGEKIIVDNMYKINVTVPHALHKNVNMQGTNMSCGFTFDNPNYNHIFIPSDDINIRMYQIKITGKVNILFYNHSLINFIKEIDVTYCDFSGQFVFMSFNIVKDDFDSKHGCGDITFRHNQMRNLSISNVGNGTIDGFISVHNHPIHTLNFNDNIIRNFTYNIIYAGITNSYTKTEKLALSRKIININRNTVINDDGFYDDRVTRPYHCLIVAECHTLIYRDNHVEGLKSSKGKAVYDVYASCMNYYCENNTWKNNISFGLVSGLLQNCLMKFKGNPDEKLIATRVIRGNTYTIDSDFASRHDKENKWLHVYLMNLTSANIDIDIISNTIEVPYLNFGSSPLSSKTIKLTDNIIKAKRIMGALCRLANAQLWGNSDTTIIEIERNKIIAEEENDIPFDFASTTSSYFTLMYHSFSNESPMPVLKNISINNNIIVGNFMSFNSFGGLFEYISAKQLVFSDNTLINIAQNSSQNSITRLFYNSHFNTLISKSNVFENLDIDTGFYYSSDISEEIFEKVLIDNNYVRMKNYHGSFYVSTIPFVNNTATRRLRFDIAFKIIKADMSEYDIKFKYILDNGKFTYINSTNNSSIVTYLTGMNPGAKYFSDSDLLRISLRDDSSLSYGRRVTIGAVNTDDLQNCEIYVTLRINTENNM